MNIGFGIWDIGLSNALLLFSLAVLCQVLFQHLLRHCEGSLDPVAISALTVKQHLLILYGDLMDEKQTVLCVYLNE